MYTEGVPARGRQAVPPTTTEMGEMDAYSESGPKLVPWIATVATGAGSQLPTHATPVVSKSHSARLSRLRLSTGRI